MTPIFRLFDDSIMPPSVFILRDFSFFEIFSSLERNLNFHSMDIRSIRTVASCAFTSLCRFVTVIHLTKLKPILDMFWRVLDVLKLGILSNELLISFDPLIIAYYCMDYLLHTPKLTTQAVLVCHSFSFGLTLIFVVS